MLTIHLITNYGGAMAEITVADIRDLAAYIAAHDGEEVARGIFFVTVEGHDCRIAVSRDGKFFWQRRDFAEVVSPLVAKEKRQLRVARLPRLRPVASGKARNRRPAA